MARKWIFIFFSFSYLNSNQLNFNFLFFHTNCDNVLWKNLCNVFVLVLTSAMFYIKCYFKLVPCLLFCSFHAFYWVDRNVVLELAGCQNLFVSTKTWSFFDRRKFGILTGIKTRISNLIQLFFLNPKTLFCKIKDPYNLYFENNNCFSGATSIWSAI